MTTKKTNPRIAVIGAGPSGITAAKNVLDAGLGDGLVVFEASDAVGGNWVYREDVQHSSVYENTHTISSRYLSEYEDFPFPSMLLIICHTNISAATFKTMPSIFK